MSFLRLQQRAGPFYLSNYGFVRRSPIYQEPLEIQALLFDVGGEIANPETIWVPLAECGHFPVGSIFGRRRARAAPPKKMFRRDCLASPKPLTFRAPRRATLHFLDTGRKAALELPLECQAWTDGIAGSQTAIYAPEILRFYLSASSLLVDTLASVPLWEPASMDLFLDPERSGWDADRTLMLTPNRPFWSSAAVLQMALLFSQPDVWNFIDRSLRRLRFAYAMETDAIAGMQMMEWPLRLSALYDDVVAELDDGGTMPMRFCPTVTADHRAPGFDEIVVRLPALDPGIAAELPAGPDEEAPEEVDRITHETTLIRAKQPSLRSFKVSDRAGRFAKRFPEWGKLQVRVIREGSPPRTPVPRTARRQRVPGPVAPEASVAPPISSGALTHLLVGPAAEPPKQAVLYVHLPTNFMAPAVGDSLVPVLVELAHLPPLMRTFLAAGALLVDDWDRVPGLSASGAGQATMLALPAIWSGLAGPGPRGEARLIAAFRLEFDHGVVWAIDIERRHIEVTT